MSTQETRRALSHAFRELTLNLIGLFDLHGADPELEEDAAEALGKVFRAHIEGGAPAPRGRGHAAMEALLDEMQAAGGAA